MKYPPENASVQDLTRFFTSATAYRDRQALKYLYQILLPREDQAAQTLAELVAYRIKRLPAEAASGRSDRDLTPPPTAQVQNQRIPQSSLPPTPARPIAAPIEPLKPKSQSIPATLPSLSLSQIPSRNRSSDNQRPYNSPPPSQSGHSASLTFPTPASRSVKKPANRRPSPAQISWEGGQLSFGQPLALIEQVQATLKRFKADDRAPQIPKELDVRGLVARLKTGIWENDSQRRRERRFLPSLIFYGSPPLALEVGLALILGELSIDGGLRSLKPIISVYFREFDRTVTPQLAAWILERLSRAPVGGKPRSWVLHWSQHIGLFGTSPAEYATRFLPPHSLDWSAWESLQLLDGSWLYPHALGLILQKAIEDDDLDTRSSVYNHLRRTEEQAGTTSSRNFQRRVESHQTLKYCIERALLSYKDDDSPDSELINLAFEVLGDPRHIEENRWSDVDKRARELMEVWLSLEDLEFFFEHLFDDQNDDAKSRVQYWKRFVDKKMVRKSRLYIGLDMEHKHKHLVKQNLNSNRYGRLIGTQDRKLCAFILQIKDAVVVDFSIVGNSCSMFDSHAFPVSFWRSPSVRSDALKAKDRRQRVTHSLDWTKRFDQKLLELFGIRI